MKEIERIKSEGWLPVSFFEPEIKNDFEISKERKELWACLLDLFVQFQKVCEANNLTYYAMGGTLLGAIRHKGFIPWDDDLDFSMPREDYEKLKALKDQFSEPYELCWIENEPENGFTFLKLRNSNTTGSSKSFLNLNVNHGIFLDIFPIDDVDIATYEDDQSTVKSLAVEITQIMKKMSMNPHEDRMEGCAKLAAYWTEIESIAQKDNGKHLPYVSNRTISFYIPKKLLWKKEWVSELMDAPFENLTMKIPRGWEQILETTFGEWTKFPPIKERGQCHNMGVFDPNTSYFEYISNRAED